MQDVVPLSIYRRTTSCIVYLYKIKTWHFSPFFGATVQFATHFWLSQRQNIARDQVEKSLLRLSVFAFNFLHCCLVSGYLNLSFPLVLFQFRRLQEKSCLFSSFFYSPQFVLLLDGFIHLGWSRPLDRCGAVSRLDIFYCVPIIFLEHYMTTKIKHVTAT